MMEEYYVECRICGEIYTFMADPNDIEAWQNGELIQRALPYLTPEIRELLISGTCPECWNKMFGEM